MSIPLLSRRLRAIAATGSLAVLLPAASASASTHEPRDSSVFACPADDVPDPGFTDTDATTVEHRASIACIVWYDLARGRTRTTYAPKLAVSRGQMATLLANLVAAGGVELPEDPPDAFADDDATEHEARIDELAALGVVRGFEDGSFGPHRAVTRAQMAALLVEAYAVITDGRLPAGDDHFDDDDGTFHEDDIDAIAEAGIAAGRTPSSYEPAAAIRRDQMATFLARVLDLLVAEGYVERPDATTPAGSGSGSGGEQDETVAVQLTSATVERGSWLRGRITSPDGVDITGASASGCGLSERPLALEGEDDVFALQIALNEPAGPCTVTFEIDPSEGDDVTEVEEVTVSGPATRLDRPELLSVEEVAGADDGQVVLRFTFDEALGGVAPDADAFRLYAGDADRTTATSAAIADGGSAVDAVFTTGAFDTATTATVAVDAVTDRDGRTNPEGAIPLGPASRWERLGYEGGETAAPDLRGAMRWGTDAQAGITFQFDAPVAQATPRVVDDVVGDVVLYLTDGTRVELGVGVVGGACTIDGSRIVCVAEQGTTESRRMLDTRLVAVEHNTVATSTSRTSARNFEASAPLD